MKQLKNRYDNIPEEIRDNALFCLWKYKERRGQSKPAKEPYQTNGKKASPSRESSFTGYYTALKEVSRYDGLGLGVFRGYSAIDIDNCFNKDGSLNPVGLFIVMLFEGCYMEKSPSGRGLRILFKAEGFRYDVEKYYINNAGIGVEVYVYGATNRFVSVTGDVYRPGGVCEASDKLQILLDTYMVRPAPNKPEPRSPGKSLLPDDSALEKAKNAKNGESFTNLFNGGIPEGKSHSEADMALCSYLAFYCGRDIEQMDRLFRQSGLMRPKWDRRQSGSTYGRITMKKAADSVGSVYNPVSRLSGAERDFEIPESVSLETLTPHDNPRYGWNDIGSSNLFADVFQSIARYVPERKQWFVYDGRAWRPDAGSLRAMSLCKKLANKLMVYALSIEDERVRKEYISLAGKWQTRKYRETILKDAADVHPISLREFDDNIYLFNCLNGTLDLETGEFREHRAEDLITRVAGVAYDPEARCVRWERYIDEIMSGDAEKAEFLQKSLGYSLTGDTRFEAMFILYGATSRNGKGTLTETYLVLIRDYGKTCRPETIGLKTINNGSAPSEDVARLAGANFVNISEPDKKLVISAALMKTLTGNDTVNARFLHENSFDFKPRFKIFINTNYLPTVTDLTLLTSGRVKIIPFERHFKESERDIGLKSEFARPENLSGILNWAIEGYKKLRQSGLNMPESVREATLAYHRESDKVGLFIEEKMVEDGNCEERTADIYYAYQEWCRENGYYPENARNFKTALSNVCRIERRRLRTGGEKTTIAIGWKLLRGTEFLA